MKKRLITLLVAFMMLIGVNVPGGIIMAQAKSLKFNPHDEIMYPCIDEVKAYLLAGANADVTRYDYKVPVQA